MKKISRKNLKKMEASLRKAADDRERAKPFTGRVAPKTESNNGNDGPPEIKASPATKRKNQKMAKPKADAVAKGSAGADAPKVSKKSKAARPRFASVNGTGCKAPPTKNANAKPAAPVVAKNREINPAMSPSPPSGTALTASVKVAGDEGKPNMGGVGGNESKRRRRRSGTSTHRDSSRMFLKPERRVRLSNGRFVEIAGLRDADGERYVWVREGRRLAVMPYSEWHSSGADASKAMRDQGITIVGGMGDVRDAVGELKRFPVAAIITRPGWSGLSFALADGRMIMIEGQPEPLKTYVPYADMLGQGGMIEGWREEVAGPLADHLLASFFMMAMFAAACSG